MVRDSPRRARHLAPIKTSFDDPPDHHLHRPHPVETILYERRDEHVAPASPSSAILVRESRFNLRGLFNRSRSAGHVDSEERPPVSKRGARLVQRPLLGNTSRSKTATGYVTPSATDTPPVETTLHSKDLGAGILRGRLSRPSKTWEPPPLFQAYPQAVKYDCLQASTLSANTILRMSNHKANKNARGQMMRSSLDLRSMEEEDQRGNNDDATKKKHRRRMSGSAAKTEWTHKIYVLATSGYLLQYSVEGNFDRLPEKVMQLGKDSAAFASDAIPGKHWVLQISQTVNEEGVVGGTNLTKSLIARMKVGRTDCRPSTSSFLLILDNPEEMDSWLVAVRKEIEAFGGRKYRPGIGSRKTTEEAVQPLQERPNRRYLIKKDLNLFPASETLQGSSPRVPGGAELDMNSWIVPSAETASMTSVTRQPYHIRPSMENPTKLRNGILDDSNQFHLAQEGSRLSYLSTGTRTLVASRGSSTATSCTKVDTSCSDVPSSILTSNKSSTMNNPRTSLHTRPPPLDLSRESLESSARRESEGRRSTHVDTEGSPSIQSLSPSTPNFSVPSFSKRYSPATNGSNASNTHKVPLLASEFRPPPPPMVSVANDYSAYLRERRPSTDEQYLPKPDRSRSWTNTTANVPITSLTSPEDSFMLSVHQFPRRFSSLEYSRGAPRSYSATSHHTSQPPHPPPNTSLPAVPSPSPLQQNPEVPLRATNPKKLRRPASMQVGSSKPRLYHSTTLPTDIWTASNKLKAPATRLQNRESRQEVAVGQPAGPPPNCPLPATPLGVVGY